MKVVTRRALALAVLLFLCGAPGARAEDNAPLQVEKILSGDAVALSDGRVVRLAGVEAFGPEAQTYLEAHVAGKAARLQAATVDRYGRTAAMLYSEGNELPVQDDLLRLGLAFVYPLTGAEAYDDEMLTTERDARQAGRGGWASADTPVERAGELIGHYGFVVGKVVAVARAGGKIYVNFGEDWREDFTIVVPASALKAFRAAGVDPLRWAGKTLRVRGWVTRGSGPEVTATDPRQVELLD